MERRIAEYRKVGIDPDNPNPDGSDFHLMNVIDDKLDKTYQECIALPSMQPHYAEQVIKMARARQVNLMRQAENNIDLQDAALHGERPAR